MTLVEVLVNRRCTHCVGALDRIVDLAERFGVPVAATDVAAHPEAAADRGVRSSPTLLVDDRVGCFGVPDAATFAALVDAGPDARRRDRPRGSPSPDPKRTRNGDATT